MTGHGWRCALIGSTLLLATQLTATTAAAIDLSVDAALAHWQYREKSAARAAFATTPLQSRASGNALNLEGRIAGDVGPLGLRLTLGDLRSGRAVDERWQLATGNQHNRFTVSEQRAMAELFHRTDRADFGLYASWLRQRQTRSDFVVNGAPIALASVREEVAVIWGGVAATARSDDWFDLASRIELGVPLDVRATNSALPAGSLFTRRRGYDALGEIAWHPKFGSESSTPLAISIAYRQRELGGEERAFGLWPTNRWSSMQLGLQLAW